MTRRAHVAEAALHVIGDERAERLDVIAAQHRVLVMITTWLEFTQAFVQVAIDRLRRNPDAHGGV
jgi:hypothetical protein